MFTWLSKQAVKSDHGFIVKSRDRFTLEYSEGDKKISVYTEPGKAPDGRWCEIIDPRAFRRWDDDPPGTIIPVEKQQEILTNFREAMEFQGIAVLVEKAEP